MSSFSSTDTRADVVFAGPAPLSTWSLQRPSAEVTTLSVPVDPGAESPQETWLRLLVIRNGFPRPQTQIPVYDEFGVLVAVLDLGWEDMKIAMDYEGEHHRIDRRRFNHDIRKAEAVAELGWVDIRVTAEDTEGGIVRRLSTAWSRRIVKMLRNFSAIFRRRRTFGVVMTCSGAAERSVGAEVLRGGRGIALEARSIVIRSCQRGHKLAREVEGHPPSLR